MNDLGSQLIGISRNPRSNRNPIGIRPYVMVNIVFVLLFLIGSIGFVAMAAMGTLHAVGGGHHGNAGGASHSQSLPSHPVAHGHLQGMGNHSPSVKIGARGLSVPKHGSNSSSRSGSQDSNSVGISRLLMAISPLDIFSLALGAGSSGILLSKLLPGSWLLPIAAMFGIFFDFGFVRPYMRYMLRFATTPSEGLEGSIAKEAEAITGFDDAGRGLVRLTLDGQHVQLLAMLDDDERKRGIQVHKGEILFITDVDAKMNTCRVTRDLTSS